MEFIHYVAALAVFFALGPPSRCSTDVDPGDGEHDLPGHMQPLGSHMPPEYVKRLSEIPSPSQFVEQYLHPKQPVVFEGLVKDLDVRRNWASDDYLRCVE